MTPRDFFRLIAAALAGAALQALAAAPTLSFDPPSPTPADNITLVIRDTTATCPYTRVGDVSETQGKIIVFLSFIGDCGFGPFSEWRTSLGRLPAGQYEVSLLAPPGISPVPPPWDVKMLTVAYKPASAAPPDNYAGHWVTDSPGEGIFVEHYGATVFVTFATYSSGKPTWLVMPAGRWTYDTLHSRGAFAGDILSVELGPGGGPVTTTVGSGTWTPDSFETAELQWQVSGATVKRILHRFRF